MAHPGVAPEDPEDRTEHVYHKYYQVSVIQMYLYSHCIILLQWVCYVLALQAGLFYVPRFLWKSTEGGRMQMLASVSHCH